ncbi:bifunctional demethylmenaquinone methyltransferase/2-methoxy-6-polyprenyl-1,4-benzoquinol methylase UbiE [Prochlorococcus marinus]|uniref:bifunctional demethylmenaquinone methyltransferase/2-methoxy-6-polyprenyl-1,4-benzoquinol methylase UbiE n=1 Tax=Prochlorococcus marinus TaxID=1219 RepID=UPI0022B5CDA7|nr:bifunctional demethylmenaquinone methyltransferase/2-methoxy-6-polyprenyl-1,4-benzoquinol methylase UbiE [Prochlorococcus marinus]
MRPRDPQAVEALFQSIAPRYDFLNDLLSFGLHRFWKRQLLSFLKPSSGENWIDLCCGTGDLSLVLARLVLPEGSVLGIDFSEAQILIATKKALKKPSLNLTWIKGDALNTGLPSNSYDGVVMAYGLRNLADPEKGIKEIHRLLKPGGKAGILDFNNAPEGSKTSSFQKFYLRNCVVPIASVMGFCKEYEYLEQSLKDFPRGELQEQIALKVGFKEASYRLLAARQMGALLLKS